VRDDRRRYVRESLGDPQAVLVGDETGCRKQGTKSAGGARQDAGTAGKIDTCQRGVFLAYASAQGRPWLARELDLPQEWLADQDRCHAAGVPAAAQVQTTPPLAPVMLERALTAGGPAQWGTGADVYGHDRKVRLWLARWPQARVMAGPANEPVWRGLQPRRVQALIAPLAAEAWQRRRAGDGAQGPRWDAWALAPLNPPLTPGWGRWVLARRSLEASTALADSAVYAPASTPLAEMVRGAGSRWSLEECLEATTGAVGLEQAEVRVWSAWYRHITLALCAHAFRTVVRAQAALEAPENGGPRHRPARLHRRHLPRPLKRSYRERCRKGGGYGGRSP
jgi:SRSO17 transposase